MSRLRPTSLAPLIRLIANAPGAMLPGQAIGSCLMPIGRGRTKLISSATKNLFQNGVPTNYPRSLATTPPSLARGEGVPEPVSLGNLGAEIQNIASQQPRHPLLNPNVGTSRLHYIGSVDGCPAAGRTAPVTPPAGTAMLRKIAEANNVLFDKAILDHSRLLTPICCSDLIKRAAIKSPENSTATSEAGEQPAFAYRFPPIKNQME